MQIQRQGNYLSICGDTLPEVWEAAVIETWKGGSEFKTQYDKEGDPSSKDCLAMLVIQNPMQEFRIHKAIPAGLDDLEIYRQEVLYGVHDNWIDPEHGAWQYSYHERLFNYTNASGDSIDQINQIIEKLSEVSYTRRAQAITWNPFKDNFCNEAACLQRIMCRIEDDKLQMNISMRSNDAFKASFMNMYAFTELQKYIANQISIKTGKEIGVGRYTHMADSFHIYGSYFGEFEKFLHRCETTSFASRVMRTDEATYFFDSGKINLLNNTHCHIPITKENWDRLYEELPQDRKGEVNTDLGTYDIAPMSSQNFLNSGE